MKIEPGASAALAAGFPPDGVDLRIYAPLALRDRTERPITVDQTNISVVVGEQAVVKWMRTPATDRTPRLLAHLAAAGFTRMPTPYAAAFRGGALIALVTEFLPEAEDGWDWCTNAILSALTGGPPANFGPILGTLAADLHAALATPTGPHTTLTTPTGPHTARPTTANSDAGPAAMADLSAIAAPYIAPPAEPPNHGSDLAKPSSLAAALESVGDDADGEWIRSIAPRLASDLSDLSGYISPAPILHLHGDLHVGQVLRWRGGYAVTDFDGNPTVESGPDFVARDLAQLRTSVLHVAEIANRRTDGRHRAALLDWGRRTADDLLTAYRSGLAGHGFAHLLDERQLRPFEVEQECRELVYAARFLPRWRYAPMGVLRSWYG